MTTISLEPIALTQSPYKQKFAIPRQANLVTEAEGLVIFNSCYSDPNMLRGLEQFSHLWLIFWFHGTADKGWSATVQPPRLGGKERVGVFASRSPFRPNPVGMSVVRNLGHEQREGRLVLRIGGLDLLDDTPILDIKPYIPYADAIDNASGGFAKSAPTTSMTIEFAEEASAQARELEARYPGLKPFIESVLAQDPRPAWRVKDTDAKQYGMTLFDLNIKWQVEADVIRVLCISKTWGG